MINCLGSLPIARIVKKKKKLYQWLSREDYFIVGVCPRINSNNKTRLETIENLKTRILNNSRTVSFFKNSNERKNLTTEMTYYFPCIFFCTRCEFVIFVFTGNSKSIKNTNIVRKREGPKVRLSVIKTYGCSL